MNLNENECSLWGFSKAERKLISTLSPHWFSVISKTSINPPKLYQILAVDAFIENKSGPEIEALRRVVNAIEKCNPYRMTEAFDKLCEF